MAARLHRASPADLEIRGDGRTVAGIAVPFDTPTDIHAPDGRYVETFVHGSFTRTIAERGDRVKFIANHNARSLPLGRATLLREDRAGLYAEFKVSQTGHGDEALTLIRDGALDAFSIGFEPVLDRWNPGRTEVQRREVALFEVSAVAFGAYPDARILAVRSIGPTVDVAEARARLSPPTRAIDRAQARARLGIITR